MDRKETINYCLDSLKKAGADKAACTMSVSEKKELNVEIGEMTLLRTTFNTNMGISVIKDQKKGATSINKTDKDSIDDAVKLVLEMAEGSQPDDAYDISERGITLASHYDLTDQQLDYITDGIKNIL